MNERARILNEIADAIDSLDWVYEYTWNGEDEMQTVDVVDSLKNLASTLRRQAEEQ